LNEENIMLKNTLLISALATVLAINANPVLAADKEQDRTQDRMQLQDKELKLSPEQQKMRDQERIYGSQLMTNQERTEYRARLSAAKTVQERKKIRKEHHEAMKLRAKERGVTLPDEPPEQGRMMDPMGPGGGMGPGSGRR
jgi:hypothetical protein